MLAPILLALAAQAVDETVVREDAPQLTAQDDSVTVPGETVAAQDGAVASDAELPDIPETPTQTASVPALVLARDTPVHLMVVNEVSTKDHAAVHKFPLRVDRAVVVGGREVIPVGTTAWGELVEASSSGNVGKRGKLSARLTHIDLAGRAVPIEGETTADGKSGKGETILGVLALGPLGLFAKGNNAKIKAGERMTAFIAEDVTIEDPTGEDAQ